MHCNAFELIAMPCVWMHNQDMSVIAAWNCNAPALSTNCPYGLRSCEFDAFCSDQQPWLLCFSRTKILNLRRIPRQGCHEHAKDFLPVWGVRKIGRFEILSYDDGCCLGGRICHAGLHVTKTLCDQHTIAISASRSLASHLRNMAISSLPC